MIWFTKGDGDLSKQPIFLISNSTLRCEEIGYSNICLDGILVMVYCDDFVKWNLCSEIQMQNLLIQPHGNEGNQRYCGSF